jgi:excisionase family DNA binding protein
LVPPGSQGPRLGARPPLLTVREVAAHLKLSTATVYKLVDRGDIPHVRVSNAIRVCLDNFAVYLSRQHAGETGDIPSPEHGGGTP